METKSFICINCPLGCPLTVTVENGEVKSVTGNTCKRGELYAVKEVTAPARTVTSTVRVLNGERPVVAVRTKTDIPKDKPSTQRRSPPPSISATSSLKMFAAPA